jgi:hypothetical protein
MSYSTRQPFSDGLVTNKINLSLGGPRYSVLFIYIGAARFLRGHRVDHSQVNLYIPLAKSMSITPNSALPLLRSTSHNAKQGVVGRWLAFAQFPPAITAQWSSLAYQTLQTQGQQQSLSLDRGTLRYDWFESLIQKTGTGLVDHWFGFLSQNRGSLPFDIDLLIDCLLHRRGDSWIAHLRDIAFAAQDRSRVLLRLYGLQEVLEMSSAMNASMSVNSLRRVLSRPQGTLRFGRGLRQLGRVNAASLRDIVDDLDTVRDRETLLRVLATLAQQCEVAAARSEFMVVPDEDDLMYLLDDLDQYGVQTIGRMLIILSALRYPREKESVEHVDVTQIEAVDGKLTEQEK